MAKEPVVHWRDPALFALLAFVPFVLLAMRRRRSGTLRFPAVPVLSRLSGGYRTRLASLLPLLRAAAVALVVVALARPQAADAPTRIVSEGIDIVMAVDVSGSMLAEDFQVDGQRTNRLEAVKDAVGRFLEKRAGDRAGLVLFAARPYTQCPLTLDHSWLMSNLQRARVGMIEDGTAIGSALASAVSRLEASDAKSKIVVLLTDGQNNAGKVSPLTAADAAKALGYRVYTIGAGTRGLAPYPSRDLFNNIVYRPVEVNVDEETLKQIASRTGGRFYRATDTESLLEIYDEIDALETSEREGLQFLVFRELYPWAAIPALLLLLIDVVLRATVLRVLP